jgi:hypothetical protein
LEVTELLIIFNTGNCRNLLGEDLGSLGVKELEQLEKRLDSSLRHIRSTRVIDLIVISLIKVIVDETIKDCTLLISVCIPLKEGWSCYAPAFEYWYYSCVVTVAEPFIRPLVGYLKIRSIG